MKPTFFYRFLVRGFFVWAVMVAAGCGKQKPAEAVNDPVPPTVTTEPDNSIAVAAKPTVVPVTITPVEGADVSPVLAQLTQALRRFSVERRQVPKSLNDLVAAGYLTKLPTAPAGKKFAIEPKQLVVVLLNR